MKELSAGIIFFTRDGHLFMGRMTGIKRKDGTSRWDIPKGHVEPGETPKEAAIRECREETGFTDFNPEALYDLGEREYSRNKNIHLFGYMRYLDPESFRNCKCTAYHTFEDGSSVPEMDAFACIKPEMWKYVMGPSLYRVMKNLYHINQA